MSKINYYYRRFIEKYKAYRTKKTVDLSEITLISQNCIGGVMYHDCGAKFLSPTVNLFIMPHDFMMFVENAEKYLSGTPIVKDGEKYPMGELSDGIKINFMHYETKEEALEKWEQRKQRINKKKIFVICIERDGFDEEAFDAFKKIPYPKALFTRNIKWKDEKDCIFMPQYESEEQVPDLIPNRMMYYKNILPKMIKKAFD